MTGNLDGLDVHPDHWKILHPILGHHLPGREIWAFGSRVCGRAKPYSDLDLMVMGNALPLSEISALTEALSESNLPWKVDVAEWARTEPGFQEIMRRRYVVLPR